MRHDPVCPIATLRTGPSHSHATSPSIPEIQRPPPQPPRPPCAPARPTATLRPLPPHSHPTAPWLHSAPQPHHDSIFRPIVTPNPLGPTSTPFHPTATQRPLRPMSPSCPLRPPRAPSTPRPPSPCPQQRHLWVSPVLSTLLPRSEMRSRCSSAMASLSAHRWAMNTPSAVAGNTPPGPHPALPPPGGGTKKKAPLAAGACITCCRADLCSEGLRSRNDAGCGHEHGRHFVGHCFPPHGHGQVTTPHPAW